MRIDEPILTSMLDDDLYKITTAAVVFHNFPNARVTYNFINRGKTPFPIGFDEELLRQVDMMSFLHLSEKEKEWMRMELSFLPPTFIEWYCSYRLNPKEVFICQNDTDLKISIIGPWYRTIMWEVKLMSVISELYFRLTKHHMSADWEKKIIKKAKNLADSDCNWMEFGTRRRYSFAVQDRVVDVMSQYIGWKGTSNPYLAFKYDTQCKGTYPHESIMALSAKVGVKEANHVWINLWQKYYKEELDIHLTDTFTTDYFVKNTLPTWVHHIKGLRQDSGDPEDCVDNKILPYYKGLMLPTINLTLCFSNNLTDKQYKKLDIKYRKIAKPLGGIGTYFTNDCGAKPLNIVIKMVSADFGDGPKPVVKLSDDPGKHTGDPEAIKAALKICSTH